jgi:hypothetical protein
MVVQELLVKVMLAEKLLPLLTTKQAAAAVAQALLAEMLLAHLQLEALPAVLAVLVQIGNL